MTVVENLLVLDAQADEAVNGEETPVVELLLRAAPVGEAIVLALEDRVERVEVSVHRVQFRAVEALRRDRKYEIVVADDCLGAVPFECQRAIFELSAVTIPQHAKQHLALHGRDRRCPVDIEVVRVPARRTVPQQVPPPWVLASGGGHVVGHDVHHQLQPVLAQCSDEPPERDLAPEILIDARRVDNVVPVTAAMRGLKDG